MKQVVQLKRGKDRSVLRRHPWVFSGAIQHIEGEPQEGDWVAVTNHKGQILGAGFFEAEGAIRVRLLTFSDAAKAESVITVNLQQAYALRQTLQLTNDPDTTAYRLVFGEGDQLPGLVIDYYDGVLVVQAHTWGMYRQLATIQAALLEMYGNQCKAIYCKSKESLPKTMEDKAENAFLYGSLTGAVLVKEHGHSFLVNIMEGQKTGFFLDQRDNRKLLQQYAKARKVLNTFCYTGGFSIYAAMGGAALVTSIDSSLPAVQMVEQNQGLNRIQGDQFMAKKQDVFEHLKEITPGAYDLIVLDPPAFAKHVRARHNALMAYKRLNMMAIEKLASNGLLFTFSCSQVVDRELFEHTIRAAAIELGREIRVLHHLEQPADHPVNLYHPEGQYLKGLVLQVK